MLQPWDVAVERQDSEVSRRAYVDDLTMWRRGGQAEVGDSIRQALEVTRRFEAAAGWSLNLRKS
eukprot:7330864-Lingulodinium_polyedra.AAC.1